MVGIIKMVYGTPKYNDVLTYLTIKSSIIIFFLPLLPNSEVQWVRASSTNMFVMLSNLAWVFIVFTILKFVKNLFLNQILLHYFENCKAMKVFLSYNVLLFTFISTSVPYHLQET